MNRVPARWRRLLCCLALVAASPWSNAQAPAAEPVFDVLEYVVEGNSVLPVASVERAVTPFLGPGLTMARVEAARAALERAYQDAGFLTVFVDVPEQRVDSGVVLLNVIEGRIERLRVSNARFFSQGYIREQVPELAEGRVPNFNVVQEQLARVNRTEDRRVQPLLRPGRTPGTVESELKVEDRLPLGFNVELNDRHAAGTKPLRLSATARYDNLFQRDHSLAVTAIVAPQQPSQSRVLTATYSVPQADGGTWVGYAVLSDSAVEPLGSTTVFGKGATFGTRYVQPLPPAEGLPEFSHSATFGVDYKDLRQRIAFAGDALSSPLRYLPFSLAYSAGLAQGEVSTSLNATAVFAVARLLQRSLDCAGLVLDQFECSRHGADGGFASLRIDLRHERPMPILGAGWRIAGRLAGQLATQPLVSAEQFVAGGADSVRGYYEAEASGDRGWLTSLELSTPNFGSRIGPIGGIAIGELTGFGFIDAARTYLYQPQLGQAPRTALAGTGFGLKLRAGRAVNARLELGWPHKLTASTPARDPRLHVSLGLQF